MTWTVSGGVAIGLVAAAIVVGVTHNAADDDRPRLHTTWELTANQPEPGCSDVRHIGTDTRYRLCASPPSCARRTSDQWKPVAWTPAFAATDPSGTPNPDWATDGDAFNCTMASVWLTAASIGEERPE